MSIREGMAANRRLWRRSASPNGYEGVRSVLDAIVEENLNVYAASPSRLQEDVSQEAQVASDYRGRLAYELLQNADDAMESSDGEDDRVVFIITDDALWMANSGRPLSDADIRGLCGLGASSKVDAGGVKRASIGHKGLGFKSVLEMTDQPRAYSTTVSFALGKALARPHIDNLVDQGRLTNVRDVPVMRFPSALADDPPTWTRLRQEGYNTAFELRFKQGFSPAARSHLADLLTTLPTTTVLFLKHLESIDVLVQMDRRTETQSWTVSRIALTDGAGAPAEGLTASGLYRISIEADGTVENFLVAHDGKVPIGDHRGGLSGPAWQGVDISEVSIAIPDTEDPADSPVEWRRFHVFLPTEEPSPYPMLVNGAFVTDLARRSVSVTDGEDDYNSHLVRSAAALFRRQLVPRLLESGSTRLLAAIDRGFRGPEEGAAESLHQAVRDALADVPTVECDGGLIALNAAIVPPQYLGSGGEQYREALGDGASWDNHRFPVPELCAGRWARILADHGGRELEPTESIEALAALVDPNRTRAVEDQTRKFRRDPVLEIAAQIWSEAENEDQDQVADSCRSVRLFPVAVADDGTVERIPLDSDEAFFPPRAGYPN
ncbi:MAG: hypothetical protein Q8Q52_00255, partial [Acidimicrobiia bacterium]|nr:hypothetical protein [Acidimicrobiia bacterium]